MSGVPVKEVVKHVKPIISLDIKDSRRRVLKLYREWYRVIPGIILEYGLPVSLEEARGKLRNEFMKHKNLTDIRAIDLLIIKGELEYKELILKFKQTSHIFQMIKGTKDVPKKDFLSKFFSGVD